MQYHHNIFNHKVYEVICHLLHSDSYINHTTRVRRYVLLYVTVLEKPALFAPKLNSILLSQFTDTLNIYPSPVYQVLNVNWSAFLKDILLTLQSHGWNNETHGGCQLDSGDLYLLPLAVWPTNVLSATVWASWLLMWCP